MVHRKIIFFKSLTYSFKSTEQLALEVLENPKYDKYPQYIDKKKIEEAFNEYGTKLNPFNTEIYTNSISYAPNVEGHFLSQNLPSQIESIVVNELCTEKVLYNYLNKHSEITDIGLSIYATGMDNSIKIIKIISENFKDINLYLGGIGVLYPQIKKLIIEGIIERKNVCYGNGINWLRQKLGFRKIKPDQIKIPEIKSSIIGLPKKVNSEYLITQIGCPYNCNFCITSTFLKYHPFCSKPQRIISRLEEIRNNYDGDIFILLCDPNAFFPLKTWRDVFSYFSIKNIKKKSDNLIFLLGLTSLAHLKELEIKNIQKNSCVKLLLINYGIESTLDGGYIKNKGITNKFIQEMRSLGIITHQNFIIGLSHHSKKNIDLEIKNNLNYDAAWFSINTLKPLPKTSVYNQIEEDGLLYGRDLPPELLYRDGFFPFTHKHLGGGFSALKYAFKSYYECEKRILDVYLNFSDAIYNNPAYESSSELQAITKLFLHMSNNNFELFKLRMHEELVNLYQKKLHNLNLL